MHLKQYFGIFLQFIILTATPMLILWQLHFGFQLIWMPGLLLLFSVIFWIGTRLRETP